jgi:hypothetical protein
VAFAIADAHGDHEPLQPGEVDQFLDFVLEGAEAV